MASNKKDNDTRIDPALYARIFDARPTKGQKRKIRILEAVIDSVAERGLENTTFETLGKRVGMNRTHVAYYYANREELISAAVKYAAAIGQQVTIEHFGKAKTWKDRFRAIVEAPFEWMSRYPKHASVMAMFYYLCTFDPRYRALQNEIRAMGEERIAGILHPLVERGELSERKARELARLVQAMLTGQLYVFFTSDYPVSLKQVKADTVKEAFRLLDRHRDE